MRTLLIIGLGDVARRALPELRRHWRVLALCRSQDAAQRARELGVVPLLGSLDDPASLTRLAGLADAVLYTAPPPDQGRHDPRMAAFLAALGKTRRIPQQVVYISTSGVYGDRRGAATPETTPLAPNSERAWRRASAERQLRGFALQHGSSLTILRAPGIYAGERLPLGRLHNATPCLLAGEDSYSNHIHADDLAGLCGAALRRTGGIRIYNASDSLPLPMGEWFDLLADHHRLPRPPRLPAAQLRQQVSPALWSFVAESRQLCNRRLGELRYRLRYPDVHAFLATLAAPGKIG